jgi:D-beta-D-heptose 7-phosphate kinase/D-beta-D-heptose 1-phosphate adenosyltransferase
MSQNLPWLLGPKRADEVRVGVIGDLILDEYLEGEVTRISPEAPIPVQRVTKTFHSAGGAANVAHNVKLAGGIPILFGVCGEDDAAARLRDILASRGIDTGGIMAVPSRPTIRKTRVTASHQQLVRIDWENVDDIPEEAQQHFLRAVEGARLDALILSDYGKGLLTDKLTRGLLAAAAARGVPTIVDPKGKDYRRYRQAFIVTPNHKEAIEALDDAAAGRLGDLELATALREKYVFENVIVTLGARGMIHVAAGQGRGEHCHLPAQAREVYDVSGAGDTVVAVMGLGIAAGLDIRSAMRYANAAAGLVVEKWGTQPVTAAELQARVNPAGAGAAARPEGGGSLRVLVGFERLNEELLDALAAASANGRLIASVLRRPRDSDREFAWKQRLLAALACVECVVGPEEALDGEQPPVTLVVGARPERPHAPDETRHDAGQLS